MKQKETPKSPMSGGKGAEVSKTLFYTGRAQRQRSSLTVILYEIWERGRSGFSPVF